MIKSLIATALLTATTLVASPEVHARECTRGQGYTLCFHLVSQNGQYNRWKVELTNAHTTEVMDVTCYNKEVDTWSSNGGFSQAEAQNLAEAFCSV
jgi:hypothetical protein|tara:strand:- start:343 stop:630 length:288 start_codon:yes stop_codon:yes gene_type:complete